MHVTGKSWKHIAAYDVARHFMQISLLSAEPGRPIVPCCHVLARKRRDLLIGSPETTATPQSAAILELLLSAVTPIVLRTLLPAIVPKRLAALLHNTCSCAVTDLVNATDRIRGFDSSIGNTTHHPRFSH
jgi:hypothetical protein